MSAEDARGTPTQSRTSPSMLVYEGGFDPSTQGPSWVIPAPFSQPMPRSFPSSFSLLARLDLSHTKDYEP